MLKQKDEIKYIILLKNNRAEVQLEQINDFNEIEEQQLNLLEVERQIDEAANEVMESNIQRPDEDQLKKGSERMINLDDFPKELIKDGKLVIKGKELSKLIAKFYRLECDLCPVKKKFKKFSVMMNHFKSDHLTKGFVSCCGGKILKIRQIALHMARHIQPEAFKCPSCNKMLTCPKILQYHIQNHLPEIERNLPCPETGCNRRFSYQSALATHSISHLPEEERTLFCCETCGRKFSTCGRLTTHINTVHTKNAPRKEFSCEICSKMFLCKSNLSYHLTTHKNFEFQVQCPLCEKWLKNKICLRKHMTIHSEVRHFCDMCEYSAVNKQCLMNHKKVQHSDAKPFNCQVGRETFLNKLF